MVKITQDYYMNILYHLCKDNVVSDALRRLSMEITNHVKEEMMELAKDVNKLVCLGFRLMDST